MESELSEAVVAQVPTSSLSGDVKHDTPETTADLNALISDQSRVSVEELDFEDYLRASFGYDKAGRTAVCVAKILDEIPDNASVLDAGCGTGNYMLPLANSGKVKSYMGLDINEGMLFHARKKAKAIRESETLSVTATTVAGSLLEGLPFDDGVFDVILLNQVLPHLTDLRVFDKYRYTTALFTEFRRVLKSGGVLAINTCTHAQLGAVWYNNAMPEACESLKSRTPEIDETKKMLLDAGFVDFNFSVDSEPLLGNKYWKYDRVFTETYRNGDAIWSLVSDEEFTKAMMKMKYALREEKDTFDSIAHNTVEKTGHTTQIFCKAPK